MREDGCLNLVVTRGGSFRARLTQMALHRMRLQSGEETAARVAFFSIPTDMTMVAVAIAGALPPIWGGTLMESGEIITVGAGHATHSRSAACSRGGTLLLPTRVLNNHARALSGAPLQIPADVSSWHPSAAAYRNLVGLHRRATAVANVRAGVLMTPEAARSWNRN